MSKRILLVFLLLASLASKAASASHIDSIAIKVLHEAKKNIDRLITDHPSQLSKFQKGIVSEDSLTLEYWVKTDPASQSYPVIEEMKEVAPKKIFKGFRFRFHTNIERPQNQINPFYSWLGTNIYLMAGWSWPNGRFGSENQALVTSAFEDACTPIFKEENKVLAELIRSSKLNKNVKNGGQKLKLQLSTETNPKGPKKLVLYGMGNANITTWFNHHLIVGDTLLHARLPSGFVVRLSPTLISPFVSLELREPTRLGNIHLPRLPEGEHQIKVIASFDTDQWLDVRPTFVDGPVVIRKIRPCWTGRIISNSLTVVIGPNGEIISSRFEPLR